jgi:hypothetical protein
MIHCWNSVGTSTCTNKQASRTKISKDHYEMLRFHTNLYTITCQMKIYIKDIFPLLLVVDSHCLCFRFHTLFIQSMLCNYVHTILRLKPKRNPPPRRENNKQNISPLLLSSKAQHKLKVASNSKCT